MAETVYFESIRLRVASVAIGQLIQIATWAGTDGPFELDPQTLSRPDSGGRVAFSPAPRRIMLYSPHVPGWPDPTSLIEDTGVCVTDLSHSRAAYTVSGPNAARYLQTLFALDLAIAAFPIGRGCATVQHDTPVFLIRQDVETFHCLVARSFHTDFEAVLISGARGWADG